MDLVELLIDENNLELTIDAVSLVEFPAMESNWVFMSKENKISLAKIDEDKKLIIGAALIPDKHILRVDENGEKFNIFFSKETVKRASELYLQSNNQKSATYEHSIKLSGISAVESWIVADNKMDKSNLYGIDVPAGTWMLSLKIDNEDVWNEIKSKNVKGFSIEGLFTHKLQELSKQVDTDEEILTALAEIMKIQ